MLKVILMGAAIYALLCLAVFLFQSRLVYFPARALDATPAAVGLGYEDVRLETDSGTTVHGWYVPGEENARTLLFLHGNAGNISHRLDSLQIFNRLGLNVLIVDYSGYGESSGKPSELQTYDDALTSWRYLTATRGVPAERIIVFGRSLGGGVASWLSTRKSPGALILESTFTSVPDLATKYYPIVPIRWLSRIRYDTLSRLPSVRCPVLVAHSRDDELVPIAHGRALFDAASEPKAFLELRGDHNAGFMSSAQIYMSGLSRFFGGLDDTPPATPVREGALRRTSGS